MTVDLINMQVVKPGQVCPNCGLARLELTPDREVACPLCGLRTGAPST